MITLITPPGHGGVRDFTDRLSKAMEADQVVKVATWSKENKDKALELMFMSDCVYLQYSGYGYAKRGAPVWLLNAIKQNRHNIKKIGIFFHELYAFGPPWGSAFWLSPVQRFIVRGLVELSDFWITNRDDSAFWLRNCNREKPNAVLPVFSNVGEIDSLSEKRQPNLIIFGSSLLREKTYKSLNNDFFDWILKNSLQIHDVGPNIKDPHLMDFLSNKNIIQHGRLDSDKVSELMRESMFGVVTYPIEYISKSGVFAAYCAHGMCPVVNSKHYTSTDGLVENSQYISISSLSNLRFNEHSDVGLAAWQWYFHHSLKEHIYQFFRLKG